MSKYKRMIYEMINQSSNHMSAEEIYRELKKICPKVVLATVYNNLNKLWAEGRIRKISVEGMADRYDKTLRHDHLVCRRCGSLADITFDDLTAKLQKQCKVELLSYDLQVFYICPQCRKLENDAQ